MNRGFEKVSYQQFREDTDTIVAYLNILNGHENNNTSALKQEEVYKSIKLPKRATKNSAGYDFFSPFSLNLKPGEEIKVPTGIKIYMEPDEYIMIVPRSSMGFKYYMRLANTVAVGDSDYFNNSNNEGHYFIKIRNESRNETLEIKEGQSFAQGIFQKYLLADYDNSVEERIGGLGSTN